MIQLNNESNRHRKRFFALYIIDNIYCVVYKECVVSLIIYY